MEVGKIGIIGSGTMGTAIAVQAALNGKSVRVYDVDREALDNAKEKITEEVEKEGGKEAIERISYHMDMGETVSDADLVVEAVPEKLDLKRDVFSQIDELAPADVVIATNSSSIPVSKIEDAVSPERKEKVLNVHFYLPNWKMADIQRGVKTSEDTFQKGKQFIEDLECEVLEVKKEHYGFVFNSIWAAIKHECLNIWAGGYASVEDVDKAFGIVFGGKWMPFELMDFVGLDVIYDIEMSYYEKYDHPYFKPPDKLKEKIDRGELGKKTGKGFYKWEDGEPAEVVE